MYGFEMWLTVGSGVVLFQVPTFGLSQIVLTLCIVERVKLLHLHIDILSLKILSQIRILMSFTL